MFNGLEDKYIGLGLAITSTMAIGTSFVITKKGLNDAADKHGFEGDGFAYLKTPLWWAGIVSLILGEIANFAAYAFAPAILVTPLGALSVLIGAVLGAYFLGEDLGTLGKLGCAICLIGSVIIVLHAPPDKEITTVDEILNDALHWGKHEEQYTEQRAANLYRFHVILPGRGRFLDRHDLQGRASIRQEEPSDLHLDLFYGGLHFRHVSKGIRNCPQADHGRQQPIYASINVGVCNHHCGMHPDTDELF
jgi:uncharacterized membrane protein